MKVAFLITAYNQPKHLHRLIKALSHPNFYFFIHVDLKTDITAFKAIDFGERVVLLEDRIAVFHGGFTLSRTMINMMKTAFDSADFDYFYFLSGSDYPIKPTHYIYDFLKSNYPTNFLDFYPLLQNTKGVENLRSYHFEDQFGNQPRIIKKYLRIAERLGSKLFPKRHFFKDIIPYRGSTWFCLNRDTVAYILNFVRSESSKKFMNYFKYVWGADEVIFHTIILNSPHAKECRHHDPEIYRPNTVHQNGGWKMPNKGYLHYIDWSRDREDPAILDMRDFEGLKASDYLFGRKFIEGKSEELLNKIDKVLLSISIVTLQTIELALL
ncbi:MAG: beta-1,6-N-acetylglucosaminyltransferase [Chlorobiales bacterium]|nr:beta-1,6-N-acetylglucosaminyltransferase [Chlorobiales bacterium]